MINPNPPEKVDKENAEGTTILRARLKRELALVKVNADTVSLMTDTVEGRIDQFRQDEGEARSIHAVSPPEFTEALRELRANVDRIFALAGVYR